MSHEVAAVERARHDIADGRPWKARERLRSYLAAHPTDPVALDLLGEVNSAMGDLPAAGAAWFLTERDDEASRRAIQALRDEHATSTKGMLGSLRVRAPIAAWPPGVQERLRELEAEANARGIRWHPTARDDHEPQDRASFTENAAIAGCLLAVITVMVCAVIGAVVVIGWVL